MISSSFLIRKKDCQEAVDGHITAGKQAEFEVCFSWKSDKSMVQLGVGCGYGVKKFSTQVPEDCVKQRCVWRGFPHTSHMETWILTFQPRECWRENVKLMCCSLCALHEVSIYRLYTLPETKHSPYKWMLGRCISYWDGVFAGPMFVSGRVVQRLAKRGTNSNVHLARLRKAWPNYHIVVCSILR